MNDEKQKKCDLLCDAILKASFKEGQKAGDRLDAERKLAEKFGVSRSTVQHAILKLTEKQMLKTVGGSGSYWLIDPQPENKSPAHIPIVMPGYNNDPALFRYVTGAEDFCNKQNIFLSIHITNSNMEHEMSIVDELAESGYKHIIVYANTDNRTSDFYRKHIRNGINFVFLDHLPCGITSDLVCSDSVEGAFLSTDYLINKGHRNILFCYDDNTVSTRVQRYQGYISALSCNNIPFRKELVLDFLASKANSELLARKLSVLFEKEDFPTACFAVDNGYAQVIYDIIKSLPNAPAGFEVLGYDSYPVHFQYPFKTAINQPFYDMGFAAAELAFRRIGGEQGGFITRTLPVKSEIQ